MGSNYHITIDFIYIRIKKIDYGIMTTIFGAITIHYHDHFLQFFLKIVVVFGSS